MSQVINLRSSKREGSLNMALNTITEGPQLCSEQAGVPRQHT